MKPTARLEGSLTADQAFSNNWTAGKAIGEKLALLRKGNAIYLEEIRMSAFGAKRTLGQSGTNERFAPKADIRIDYRRATVLSRSVNLTRIHISTCSYSVQAEQY